MKRFISLLLVILLSMLPLLSRTIVLDKDGFGFENRDMSLFLSYYGIKLRSSFFSFGAVDSGGLIAKLSNPYAKGGNLFLSFSDVKENTSLIGSEIDYKGCSLFSISGSRNGFGIGIRGERYSAFSLFFQKGQEEGIQGEEILRKDRDVFYCGGRGGNKHFDFTFLLSVNENYYMSSFLSAKMMIGRLFFACSMGRVQALKVNSRDWRRSFSVGMREKSVEIEYEIKLGHDAVYDNEYRSIEFSSSGKLELGGLVLSADTDMLFHEGREYSSLSLSVEGRVWKVKVSNDKKITISFHFRDATLLIEDKRIITDVVLIRKGEKEETVVRVKSDGFPSFSESTVSPEERS